MNTNSAITGFYTKNLFWYQQFHLTQIRILEGGQPNVDFDAAEKCRQTLRRLQIDFPSIPIDNFKDHYV